MSISAIISNFNGEKYLPKLLDSLESQANVELEIIVVDRNSSDNSIQIINQYSNVKLLSEPPQSGLVSGYSAGVPLASKQNLFFCNEDMWFEPDCLAKLESQIDLENRIAAADPWQWTYDKKTWAHGGLQFENCLWNVNSSYPFRCWNPFIEKQNGDIIPFCCAGAMLIDKKVFIDLGGWDCSFFLDDEDIDLFIRYWQQDWLAVTVPEAKVYHAIGASAAHSLGSTPVNQRRYISTYANKTIIGLKYFSMPHVTLSFLGWLVRFTNNIVKARFRYGWFDILSAIEVFKRIPETLQFRKQNKHWNKIKPGQKFYYDNRFDSTTLNN